MRSRDDENWPSRSCMTSTEIEKGTADLSTKMSSDPITSSDSRGANRIITRSMVHSCRNETSPSRVVMAGCETISTMSAEIEEAIADLSTDITTSYPAASMDSKGEERLPWVVITARKTRWFCPVYKQVVSMGR